MFGEQHLVRFGSMSKPVGLDPPATLQDSDLDPPQAIPFLHDPNILPDPMSLAAAMINVHAHV